jgi:hypothetical protein
VAEEKKELAAAHANEILLRDQRSAGTLSGAFRTDPGEERRGLQPLLVTEVNGKAMANRSVRWGEKRRTIRP